MMSHLSPVVLTQSVLLGLAVHRDQVVLHSGIVLACALRLPLVLEPPVLSLHRLLRLFLQLSLPLRFHLSL